jgi:hypothetical protein
LPCSSEVEPFTHEIARCRFRDRGFVDRILRTSPRRHTCTGIRTTYRRQRARSRNLDFSVVHWRATHRD